MPHYRVKERPWPDVFRRRRWPKLWKRTGLKRPWGLYRCDPDGDKMVACFPTEAEAVEQRDMLNRFTDGRGNGR